MLEAESLMSLRGIQENSRVSEEFRGTFLFLQLQIRIMKIEMLSLYSIRHDSSNTNSYVFNNRATFKCLGSQSLRGAS